MHRLTAAAVGFLVATVLALSLVVAAANGLVPGVSLAVSRPPLVGYGIVHRPLTDAEDRISGLTTADTTHVLSIDRFEVKPTVTGSIEVWVEAWERGRSLGRVYSWRQDLDEPVSEFTVVLMTSPELEIRWQANSWGAGAVVDPPVRIDGAMGGSFHTDPSSWAPGEPVPLRWWVTNEPTASDQFIPGLPGDVSDPLAGDDDVATVLAGYDYAFIVWARFQN